MVCLSHFSRNISSLCLFVLTTDLVGANAAHFHVALLCSCTGRINAAECTLYLICHEKCVLLKKKYCLSSQCLLYHNLTFNMIVVYCSLYRFNHAIPLL